MYAELFFDEQNFIFVGSHLLWATVEFCIDSPDTFEFLADFCFEKWQSVSDSVYLLSLTIEFCLESVDLIIFSSELHFVQREVTEEFIFY